ncbi:hypothetical protein J4232_03395 [Candidatus Woesearchaeota archaeon]|nr:hypothetical protein [Candidatus Woesearchaeota archaeon]
MFNKKAQGMLFFNLQYYVIGFILGFIVAGVVVFLSMKGVIPFNICG